MPAAFSQPPIGEPMTYDAAFKVEVFLHEPLWTNTASPRDIAMETVAICAELDVLCKKELLQHPDQRIDHGAHLSNVFEMSAMVLMDRLQATLCQLPVPHPSLPDYLDVTGISRLYPRASAYVTRPQDLSLSLKKTSMESHFEQLSSIHQVAALAHQIHTDVAGLNNHKYVAHQIAVLYQSLASLSENDVAREARENIEERFREVKDGLTEQQDNGIIPQLPEPHQQWLLELTSDLVAELTTLPANLCPNLTTAAQVATQLS